MLEIINGYSIICSEDESDPASDFRTILGAKLNDVGEFDYVVATARVAASCPTSWLSGQYFDSPYDSSFVRLHQAQRALDRKVHGYLAV